MKHRFLFLMRNCVLWIAIGCTVAGLIFTFMPDSGGSVLYLIGFPILCVVLFF